MLSEDSRNVSVAPGHARLRVEDSGLEGDSPACSYQPSLVSPYFWVQGTTESACRVYLKMHLASASTDYWLLSTCYLPLKALRSKGNGSAVKASGLQPWRHNFATLASLRLSFFHCDGYLSINKSIDIPYIYILHINLFIVMCMYLTTYYLCIYTWYIYTHH